MLRTIIAFTFISLLSACVTTGTTPGANNIQVEPELLVPCEELSSVADNPTPSEVLAAHQEDVRRYELCSVRQRGLAEIVKKLK